MCPPVAQRSSSVPAVYRGRGSEKIVYILFERREHDVAGPSVNRWYSLDLISATRRVFVNWTFQHSTTTKVVVAGCVIIHSFSVLY